MKISIIIPTHNEAKTIASLIDFLQIESKEYDSEIIVVDGGSTDNTVEILSSKNVRVVISEIKGRANQLNLGAANATGDIFYFVHADTFPPQNFIPLILHALSLNYGAGCFRYTFNPPKKMLAINAWFTKFKGFYAGGGDQTLFISHKIFTNLNGYNPNFVIMEDFELVRRLRKKYSFTILKEPAIVSSRKYELNNYWSVQKANLIAILQFKFGVNPITIKNGYQRRIKANN